MAVGDSGDREDLRLVKDDVLAVVNAPPMRFRLPQHRVEPAAAASENRAQERDREGARTESGGLRGEKGGQGRSWGEQGAG